MSFVTSFVKPFVKQPDAAAGPSQGAAESLAQARARHADLWAQMPPRLRTHKIGRAALRLLWETRLNWRDIVGPRGPAPTAAARQAMTWVLREGTDWSLLTLSGLLQRHHATLLYSLAKVEAAHAGGQDKISNKINVLLMKAAGPTPRKRAKAKLCPAHISITGATAPGATRQ